MHVLGSHLRRLIEQVRHRLDHILFEHDREAVFLSRVLEGISHFIQPQHKVLEVKQNDLMLLADLALRRIIAHTHMDLFCFFIFFALAEAIWERPPAD